MATQHDLQWHLEAIKFLKEWSTSLVVIQSGALAVIGHILTDGGLTTKRWIIVLSMISFLLSIATAAHLIGAIPYLVQHFPKRLKAQADIYRMTNYFGIPLWCLALTQHVFFFVGIIAFSAFVMAQDGP